MLVSILLPTYNRLDMLKKALNSAINQTYKDIEILVGDNCSEDGTEAYMLEEMKKDSRIQYYRWEENIGAYNNTARLITKIKGEYFVFMNDDDWLDLNYVEECANFIYANEGYAFVTPSIILYNEDYKYTKACYIPDITSDDTKKRIRLLLKTYWESDVVSGFFTKQVLTDMEKYDGYYFKKRIIEDVVFMIRALAVGKGKVLSHVHYNKLNNGKTRVLENITSDYCDTTGITRKNFKKNCINCVCDTIKNDKIFAQKIKNPKLFSRFLNLYLNYVWSAHPVMRVPRIIKLMILYNRVFS